PAARAAGRENAEKSTLGEARRRYAARMALPELGSISALWANVTPSSCRWPSGDAHESGFAFCGAPAVRGRSYCAAHNLRAIDARAPQRILRQAQGRLLRQPFDRLRTAQAKRPFDRLRAGPGQDTTQLGLRVNCN